MIIGREYSDGAWHLCLGEACKSLFQEDESWKGAGRGWWYLRLGICLSRCSFLVKLFPQYVQKIMISIWAAHSSLAPRILYRSRQSANQKVQRSSKLIPDAGRCIGGLTGKCWRGKVWKCCFVVGVPFRYRTLVSGRCCETKPENYDKTRTDFFPIKQASFLTNDVCMYVCMQMHEWISATTNSVLGD